MVDSSPAARRSQQLSSPNGSGLSSFLTENRNTELNHQNALAAAQAEHERVREAAIRTFQEHMMQEEQKRQRERHESILLQQRRELERIRTEEYIRAEEERLRALKAKTVPNLPPAPEPQASPAEVNGSDPSRHAAQQVAAPKATPSTPEPSTAVKNPFAQANGTGTAQSPQPTLPNPFKKTESIPQLTIQPTTQPTTQKASPTTLSAQAKPFTPTGLQQNGVSAPGSTKPPVAAGTDRYVEIHKNLKKLRASLLQQAKLSPPLKKRLGDMRREMRKNMGQLTGEKGGNKKQIAAIQVLLDESLSGSVPSELIDPSNFVTDQREPVDGALHNEPKLPSLFLYLLNQFSKTVINQFIDECGAQPRTANPIGVVAAMVFSHDRYLWRGKTLIDILMAKFRVVCPVLFGYHGSEKTDAGRQQLGWKRGESGAWIPEQQHSDRMKGLGAGYAAIALRNFSLSKYNSPWPPTHYWKAIADIVNTPAAEMSDTQCIVLRAIIEDSEIKFIQFYGNAAIAALRKALVEFPNNAQAKSPGVFGLQVLAQMMKQNLGVDL
ncbi:GLE1-domain-containing protein [Hypoxylon sp. FL1284]|nr:GLE1-domain-containing protein [Hypoxylon sp. FL1284]